MANFSLTVDEFKNANFSPIGRPWKRAIAWSVGGLILIGSGLVGQHAFSVMWSVLLVFIYLTFYRMTPRIEANRIKNNPFALGPFELQLRPDSYTIRVGKTELNLALAEFGLAHDFKTHYRLDHKSGVALVVPKRALSAEEVNTIETYRKRFPGAPENTQIPAY